MVRAPVIAGLVLLLMGRTAAAANRPAFTCGGFALLGGAQLLCSHTDPQAPAQICSFSWSLTGSEGTPTVVQGSFRLEPGVANAVVYQGSGFAYALTSPIVLCEGRASTP